MALSPIITAKIRKYIKRLKGKHQKYTFEEAFQQISDQIKQDEGLREEEMAGINEDIWARLKENWPFKRKI